VVALEKVPVAVLSIIFTAPLGAVAIKLVGERVLEVESEASLAAVVAASSSK
jgi:hypothetical protein